MKSPAKVVHHRGREWGGERGGGNRRKHENNRVDKGEGTVNSGRVQNSIRVESEEISRLVRSTLPVDFARGRGAGGARRGEAHGYVTKTSQVGRMEVSTSMQDGRMQDLLCRRRGNAPRLLPFARDYSTY